MADTTPIDPRDIDRLRTIYWQTHQEVYDADPQAHVEDRIEESILAVARAVLPVGFVAVPVAEIAKRITAMASVSGHLDSGHIGRSMLPIGQALDWLRSLLPESEVTP